MHSNYSRRSYLARSGVALAGVGSLSGCLGTLRGGRGTVTFGSVLPTSMDGLLGELGTAHTKAVEQAVADVRQAGGPLDSDIELRTHDSKVDGETAVGECEKLVSEGAVGFVGALVSDVSLVLADFVSENDIVQVSPSSTTPTLAARGYNDDVKFVGRTAPNDIQQAFVMAKALNDDKHVGADDVGILYLNNAFGNSLAQEVAAAFDGRVTDQVTFEAGKDSYDDTIAQVTGDDPDAIAVVSSPGSTKGVLQRGVESGYEGDWVLSAGLIPDAPPRYFEGLYGATMASQRSTGAQKLAQKLGDIAPLPPYTQHAYDALFLQALAVERAGEATPKAVAENLRAVSGGRGHTVTVGEFGRAKQLLDAGREINYEGASSSVDLNEDLEPLNPYVIQRVRGGTVRELELVKTSFFEGATDE
ncbi:ABC transporter substrate-binding protein [Halorussus sp. MSC15.2]|uniref:ABC transporter substrate-binding protein n=1 Tax=Halorussus sp. MSC15.2 TaxID=2283638 RepID=UPI0013D3805C|nr:ABC transporter substrate-binding protein [Halorussus sp. MSC15.2]NEU57712.1 ABC transporter substrate-binding protein [Halorussus sp. MSC15.2]